MDITNHIEPMMKKQPLEFFEADSWRVRLAVLLVDRLTKTVLLVCGVSGLVTLIKVYIGH